MEFSLTAPYSHIQIVCVPGIAEQTCLNHNRVFEVNVVDLRLDVFRFLAKKQASQKDSLFFLKFVMIAIKFPTQSFY